MRYLLNYFFTVCPNKFQYKHQIRCNIQHRNYNCLATCGNNVCRLLKAVVASTNCIGLPAGAAALITTRRAVVVLCARIAVRVALSPSRVLRLPLLRSQLLEPHCVRVPEATMSTYESLDLHPNASAAAHHIMHIPH